MSGDVGASVTASVQGRIGPYEVGEVLGEGTTGVVHRAVDEEGRVVALKIIRPELCVDTLYRRRLAQEVRAAREIRHRHIVPLLDAGEADGSMYIAFAFIEGSETLAARLAARGALPAADAVHVALQVGSAIDALHAHGIVHRDVKPSNVIVAGADFQLTDFGLAKGRAYTVLTRPGRALGTVDYMAPELIRGQGASEATDMYAFGCTVYECVTGNPPFAGRSMIEVGIAHLEEAPPDPAASRSDLPAGFSFALLKALAKDPAERPRTATAYSRMLQIGLNGAR